MDAAVLYLTKDDTAEGRNDARWLRRAKRRLCGVCGGLGDVHTPGCPEDVQPDPADEMPEAA